MSGYRLKKDFPEFQVMREGPFDHHYFMYGVIYDQVPEEDRHKFERVVTGSEKEKGGGKKK